MNFISIDSSLAHTGIAVGSIGPTGKIIVNETFLASTVKTKNKQVRASSDTIQRCKQTFEFVHNLVNLYKPHIIFVETPSGSQSSAGMKSYGTTCQLIASLGDAVEVTPTEVKLASVGSKTASKKDMIEWAVNRYPNLEWYYHNNKLQSKNEHIADAIAIAYAGIKTADFLRLQTLINKL